MKEWQRELYATDRAAIASGGRPTEDVRSVDWIYLAPLDQHLDALVVDPDAAVLPRALAGVCRRVIVVVPSLERAALFKRRLSDIEGDVAVVVADPDGGLPFRGRTFGLVALRGLGTRPQHVLSNAAQLVGPGGLLTVTIRNAIGLDRLLRPGGDSRMTMRGCRWALERAQFELISAHAPLPSPTGTPFFYVPVDSPSAMAVLARDLLPLVDAVSPEVKRAYWLERSLLRLLAPMLRSRLIAAGAAQLLPGYLVIARRG